MPRSGRLSFLDAAVRVLVEEGGPLHVNEICDRALRNGLVETRGRSPRATMAARLAGEVSRLGERSRFRRVRPNTFALVDGGQGAPPQRERSTRLWPLPGGVEHYAATLREMLQHVEQERASGRRVDVDALADWLAARYRLSGQQTPRGYAWLAVQIGVAEQGDGGALALTEEGRHFASAVTAGFWDDCSSTA